MFFLQALKRVMEIEGMELEIIINPKTTDDGQAVIQVNCSTWRPFQEDSTIPKEVQEDPEDHRVGSFDSHRRCVLWSQRHFARHGHRYELQIILFHYHLVLTNSRSGGKRGSKNRHPGRMQP